MAVDETLLKERLSEVLGPSTRFAVVYVEDAPDAPLSLVCHDDDDERATILLETYCAEFRGEKFDRVT